MTWTPWALPGLTSAAMAISAAVVLFRAAPDRSLNRRLALVLLLEGVWASAAIFYMVESPTVFMVIAAIGVGAMAALPFQYLAFLGVALDTPLVRPFRSRGAFLVLTALSVTLAASVILLPQVFIGELIPERWATWNFRFTPWGSRLSLLHGVSSLFALVASALAFLGAERGTAARERARWFAIAFGVRDVVYASLYSFYPQLRPIPFWGDFFYNQLGAYTTMTLVAILSYAVLRRQLFDLDLKIKFAIRQSTVGAIIAAAFFVGSEILERFIPVQGSILGLLAAGAIVLALKPVQRFAEAIAGRLMPGVTDTPEYVDQQKREVYRAALEGAAEDGDITDRERSILDRLAAQLGLDPDVAAALERQVSAAAG